MNIGHDPVVVTNTGDAGILPSTAVNGYIFANSIAVTNLKPGVFTCVFLVLGFESQRGKRIDAVVFAEDGAPTNDYVRTNIAIGGNLNISADNTVRPDNNAGSDARRRINSRLSCARCT
jgi:hypothetical protein